MPRRCSPRPGPFPEFLLVSYWPLEDGPRRPRAAAWALPPIAAAAGTLPRAAAAVPLLLRHRELRRKPPEKPRKTGFAHNSKTTATNTMQAPNRPTRRRRRIVESDDSEEEVTYEVAPTVAPPPQKKSRAQKPRPPQRPAKRPCAEARPVLRENARLTQPSQKQPRRRGAAPTPRPPTPEWDVDPEDEDEHAAGARGRGGRAREAEAAAAFEASQTKARTATSGSTGGTTRAPPRSGSTGGTTRAPPAPPPVPCQLTADQRAVAAWRPPAWAADRRGKLVRVVAHAGTGKTTTLAALAANLAASARAGVHIHRPRGVGEVTGGRRRGSLPTGETQRGRAALAQAQLLDLQPLGRRRRGPALRRAHH